MLTDPLDAQAIEQSLLVASERGGDLTAVVYARLFEREPQMESLFWRDTRNTIKAEMLSRAFEAILDFVGPRHFADHLVRAEAVTHDGYDVPPAVFATFFRLLAEVVEEVCGPSWSPAMAGAWRRMLDEVDGYVSPAPADISPSRAF